MSRTFATDFATLPRDAVAAVAARLRNRDAASLAQVSRAAREAVDMPARRRAQQARARRLEPMIRDVVAALPFFSGRATLPPAGRRVPGTTGLTVEANEEAPTGPYAVVTGAYGAYTVLMREVAGSHTFAIYKNERIVTIQPVRGRVGAVLARGVDREERAVLRMALTAVLGAGAVSDEPCVVRTGLRGCRVYAR